MPSAERSVNPELLEERAKIRFNVVALSAFVQGSERAENERVIGEIFEAVPELNDPCDVSFLSREERYENACRKTVLMINNQDLVGDPDIAKMWLMRSNLFSSDKSPFELHYSMFVPTLQSQGSDEQINKWLPLALSHVICGTYAQTELGHGTDLRRLETTATYDPSANEFVLNSPTLTSMKWWPGNLGKSSNHALVQAQLWTKGKCHGTHLFIVQLRDLESHQPLPGITVGDIGPKMGFVSVDNGFLKLDSVRIPRDQMLNRHAQVDRDGTYHSPPHSKVGYAGMLFVRAMMIHDVAISLAKAVTIATRYSCVRRQGEKKPGAGEVKLLDYATQQYKLFPYLASAYAFVFAGRYIRRVYETVSEEVKGGNVELLPELHAIASGLKAYVTWESVRGIEICRLACGGHGYSLASQLPQLYQAMTPSCTYEGDNTVMLLQVARYLVKAHRSATASHLSKTAAYLVKQLPEKSRLDQFVLKEHLLEAYEHAAQRLVRECVEKLDQLRQRGYTQEETWDMTAIEFVRAAKAHVNAFIVRNFIDTLTRVEESSVLHMLTQLCRLYAIFHIYKRPGKFLEDGYLSNQQIHYIREALSDALSELRPQAVGLVDAFALTDRELNFSVLGRYDGMVYENLYKWAAESPLNKKSVLDAHHKYVGPMMKEARSKL